METILLQRIIISCLSVMVYITAIAAGCKRHPSNLTNINIVTEPKTMPTEKVTTGETTSNVLPSVKSFSGSLSQEEKKEEKDENIEEEEEEEEEQEEDIQKLVEAEQVLEEERNLLKQEVNAGRQSASAPSPRWDEQMYSFKHRGFPSEYDQQPPSYDSSSTTFPGDPSPPSYESHQFDDLPTFGTSFNANIDLKSIYNPNDLKNALKHRTHKYQYITYYLGKVRSLKPKGIFWLKIKQKDLDDLEEKLKKSEHKKNILEQAKNTIFSDETYIGDKEMPIKIISISIEIREYEIKYLKKTIQKKKERKKKKELDHTNNGNLSQGSCTNSTNDTNNLYPNLTQVT